MTEYYSVSSTNSAALSSFLAWHLLMSKTKRRQIQMQKKRVPCVPCLHCLPVSRWASSSFWSLFKSTRLKCIKYNIHTCPIKHCKDCEWCPLSSLSMVTSLLDFSLRLPLSLSLSLLLFLNIACMNSIVILFCFMNSSFVDGIVYIICMWWCNSWCTTAISDPPTLTS